LKPVIFVHGGAGNDYHHLIDLFRKEVESAARAGWASLLKGGSALDAVETAIRCMEDAPVFDAGHGSYLNSDDEIEMDAMVMDGLRLQYGAVAGIQRVANPVSVARMVIEHTSHSLFIGAGAEKFARKMGVPVCPMEELITNSNTHMLRPQDRLFDPTNHPGDTVGAIALDREGNLAVAVSTGGTAGKLAGRVGDSPIIGCGGYADNACGAAVATGHGEALMKIVISKTACDMVANGLSPQLAAEAVIQLLKTKTGDSQGGVIVISPSGETGCAFNTQHMARALIRGDDEVQVED
jgi:beta-aspartyl-peptidase (threonine type)